jgi:hypothetical protein
MPEWFLDYNKNHPHSGLDMKSPMEYRTEAQKQTEEVIVQKGSTTQYKVSFWTSSQVEHFTVIMTSSYFGDARTLDFEVCTDDETTVLTLKSKDDLKMNLLRHIDFYATKIYWGYLNPKTDSYFLKYTRIPSQGLEKGSAHGCAVSGIR